MKKYLLLFIVPLIFVACDVQPADKTQAPVANNNEVNPKTPTAGDLPSFKMVDAKGLAVNLTDFKGKKIFVNIWASWCPPCRAEIPSIENLYQKTDRSKVAFVMLSFDKDFETGIKFSEKNNMKTPLYHAAGELPKLFSVEGIPATFIFDEKGQLISRIDGGDNYDTEKYLSLLK